MTAAERSAHALAETAEETLARRAESLALETLDEEVTDRLSLLLFRIGEEWYAVRVSDVREIFQEYELTQIPCVPDYILGVVNVRGEILSVTDSARIMGIGSVETRDGVAPPAIVVSNDEVVTAMVVDEIGDIAEVPNGAIEPPISIIDRSQAEFVSGSVYIDGSMVGLINIERMLEPVVVGRH
jgi:purine-binding chemotaxis protein CheW